MIRAPEVMPLLLLACPSFEEIWREIESEHADESSHEGRLHYWDASDFVRHIVSLRVAGTTDEFAAIFEVVESFVVDGDPYVTSLGVIGLPRGLADAHCQQRGS